MPLLCTSAAIHKQVKYLPDKHHILLLGQEVSENCGIAAMPILLLWVNSRCIFLGSVVLVLLKNTEN